MSVLVDVVATGLQVLAWWCLIAFLLGPLIGAWLGGPWGPR